MNRPVALAWTMLVLGLYYLVHKPITAPLAEALGGALLDLGVAALFALTAGGLGRAALHGLDLAAWSLAERIAAQGLIGLALLSLAIVAVGALALTRASLLLLLILALALTQRAARAWARDLRRWLGGGLPRAGWTRFAALVAVILLSLALIGALLPPTMWDVLTYHLAGPQTYVRQGRFYAAPHNNFLGFPQLVDTLFAGQLALSGRLTGAAPLHWWIGALALLLAGGVAARRAGPSAGWLAVVSLLAAKTIWLEMTAAYVDLMPLGLALIGLGLAERWHAARSLADESRPPQPAPDLRVGLRYLLWLGAVAGFAMGVKYTAIWLGAALGVLVLGLSWREGARRALTFGAIYGVAAALVVAPWLIRTWIWYGSPTYPLFFEAGEVDAVRLDWYARPGSGLIHGEQAWQLAVFPLAATVLGVEGGEGYSADVGPLFLLLTPLLILTWPHLDPGERRTARRALAVAGVILALWMVNAAFGSFFSVQTRLVLYLLGPLAVTSGIAFGALRRLPRRPLDLGFVLQALVSLALALTLIDGLVTFIRSGADRYFSGRTGYRTAYLEHALGWHYAALADVNARLPEGAAVRFLWEPRTLYCDGDRLRCIADDQLDSWYHARRAVGDGSPAAIAAAWRSTADYWLVYDLGRRFERDGVDRYTPDDWAAWGAFVGAHLAEVERYGSDRAAPTYVLYRWRE